MKNIKTSMVKISRVFLLLIFVLTAFNSFAKQIPTVTGIMKTTSYATSPVVVGNPTATNIIFVNALANAADYNIKNTVSLKYDLNTDTFFLNPTTLKVKVLVKIYNAGGTQIGSTTTKSLTIIINNKLNQPILEQSSLKLTNGYKVEVTIADIWLNGVQAVTLPKWASVESEINMDRYYDFSSASTTSAAITTTVQLDDDCDGIFDELQVNWSIPSSNPEEYQLEWVYVNNYSSLISGPVYPKSAFFADFKNNSTRITTYDNKYKVSLLFDKGYIAFRVRSVGRDWLNPTKLIYSPWSAPDIVQLSNTGVTGLNSANAVYEITQDHEKDKNWQYATTYAEEGKKKEVINYFDGSLHNRQTVTKINSDNNVIVGETMYDFQGRPAINVLPVPVNFPVCTLAIAPAIRYYPKFNVNSSGMPYSKIDFDEDGGSCLSNTSIMDSISGASQYYSNNNPNKSKQQAFLPHAQKFPFTQVEYTPDNTGRIRNQSGVGKIYQLGTGKETKYLYGQPNQLQVDRLFGSETGDASHYKKNVVIDANGQSSVTYLNQEGKTIATALAGIPPTETGGTNTRLDSLPYANANQAKFTIDLFNKNASGKSLLNVVPPSNDQIVFSSQLLVTFRSLYEFQYTLNIDTVHDACLRNGICFNCVYDLEIQVKDECGIPVTSAANIKKNVGKFSLDSVNNLVFSTSCGTGPSLYSDVEAFNIILQPGVYTVSKILKVNKEAKDFYVKAYLDSLNNSCYKSLSQFQAAELAKIDTMDCYVSCASCAADLGKQDDYVASGRGTAEQWLFLIDKCNEPCRRQTLCEVTYDMMLSDVSPGGQYGKFNSTTFDASSEPLSVFNVSNALRSRITAGGGTWRKPYIRLGGFLYPMYLDEDGVRKRVNLTLVSPGIYSPQVLNTSLVYTDPVTGVLYTFPENLKNLADFISEWDPNFAKSLVLYHPEYAYYLSCSDHNVKYPGSNSTTNQIDSLMETCSSFAQAMAPLGVGFIKAGAIGSTAQAQNKMRDLVNSTTGLNDPFFSNSLFQYSVTPVNPVTGAKTNVKMDAAPFFFNIQNEMNYIVNNYKFIGSIPYTMADVAAIVTRCGNNFSTTPTAACMAFGNDFYPSTYPNFAALNDSIRNQEWRLYKQFYLAEKQKLQFKRMDFYARYLNDGNSNFYGGCNACIGNSGFDPFATKMILPPPFPYNTYPYSPFFDGSQPCHYGSFADYGAVTKRFYDPANTGLNPSSAAVQLYNMTGQCPITFDLQNFLNSIAKSGTLTTNNVSLNTIPEFGPDLYVAVSGGIAPATFINYKWQVSTSGNILTANFVDPSTSNTACVLTIDKSNIPSVSFSNFIGINQLVYDAIGPPTGTFKAVVVYTTSPTTTLSANITGNTTCINLKNCVFDQVCTPNQLATDVSKLFSALQVAGQLSSTSPVSLNSDTTLKKFLTPTIKTNVNATVYTNLVYKLVPPNQYMIYESTGTTSLVLTVTNENPPGCISASSSFANIKSNYNNNFKMDAKNAVYAKIGEVEGKAERWETSPTTQTINLSMGDCGIPELPECATNEHKVRKDMELLVKEILTSKPVNSGSANLFVYASFSPLLKSYIPNTLTSTSGNYIVKTTASPNYDTLKINIPGTTSTCVFTIYHYRNDGSIQNFSNVTNVSDLQGIGVPDIAGNYSYFRAIATYVYGTNTYKDTIFGHSCWPIKNCDPCPLSSNPAGTARSMSQINNSLITDHNAFLIPAIPAYNSYRAAVDSVNAQNGWGPLDSNYVQKMSYKDFTLRGFFNSENYIKFIQNFDPAVDSRIMLEPDSFVYYYGNLTNCNQEYDRYVRAIAKYNIRASAVSGATILAAIKDSIFYHNHLCDTSFAYLKYLRGYPAAGPNPDDILQFFNITNPNPIYLDSCKVEYDYYIKAHHDFTNDALAQSNCKNANILHPLYSYDAIVNNNLCGSSIGLNVFKSYVGSLKTASVTCPSPLPSLTAKTSAASYAPVLPLCHTYYIAFINAINSYNSSTYASVHSHSLNPNIYPTFYSFYKSGYCDCVLDYINYLNAYTSAPGSAIFVPVLPADIDNYSGCPHSTPAVPDSCDLVVYTAYYTAITNYNNYVYSLTGDSLLIVNQLPYIDFVSAGYCKCGSKFAEGLNAIVSGSLNPTEVLSMLDIENVCGEKPCTRPMDSTFVFPPYVKYDNPCVQQQINLALQNAANAFQQYQDSLKTYFADKYTRHCLNAFEDFNYKYVDKEYHFTLYYYDQAGNLIKTVPPEGVKPINITSYSDAEAVQINFDRTFDQQNVFTDHTMQTNYVYNSLNQLIYQSLPDHEKMDICDGINPNGLDTGLVINTVQFVTPNKGYLCGYIKNSQVKRGYVYTSDDAGGTWRKLTGITAANMQKVQFVNANIGYAVSDFGMLFKTLDGGNTWDVMIGLYNPTSGTRQVGMLSTLCFTNTTDGIVGGTKNGGTFFTYSTIDGGNTFNNVTVTVPVTNGDSITSIVHDGTNYLATSRNGNRGWLYTKTGTGSWARITSYNVNNLKKVQYIASGVAYAVGEEGTLLRSNGSNTTWTLVPTGFSGNINDIYFKNTNEGVALIDSVPGKALLYKTSDGGLTWQLFGDHGEFYRSLEIHNAATDKLIAVGQKGLGYSLIARILLNTTPFGITKLKPYIGAPLPGLDYGDATEIGTTGKIIAVVTNSILATTASSSYQMFTTFNGQDLYPTWTAIDLNSWGFISGHLPHATLKKILVTHCGTASSPTIQALVLTTTGKLYRFRQGGTGTTLVGDFLPPSYTFPTNAFFEDITSDNQSTGTTFYALDKVNNQVYALSIANNYLSTTTATLLPNSTSNPLTGSIKSIDISNNQQQLLAVGDNGKISVCTNVMVPPIISPPQLIWNDPSIVPTAFTDVKATPGATGDFIVTGIDGSVWKNSNTSNLFAPWVLKNTGTAEKLNAVDINASGTGFIVGNNGKLLKVTGGNTSSPSFATIAAPVNANLNDIALDPFVTTAPIPALISASNGDVLRNSDYTTGSVFTSVANFAPSSMNGVCYKSANIGVAVGNNNLISTLYGPNNVVTKNINTRGLYSIHFTDPNNGFVIDSNYVIRRTTDGGNNWSVVIPTNGNNKLNRIYTTKTNQAIAIGNNRYIGIINGNTITQILPSSIPVATGTDFYDINFAPGNTYGVIVGSNTRVLNIQPATATTYNTAFIGQPVTSTPFPDFRTVHVFNDKSFITAGTRGEIYYRDFTTGLFYQQSNYPSIYGVVKNTITIKDIYFRDNYSGYFVGDKGQIFKVKLLSAIQTLTTSSNNINWQTLCTAPVNLGYASNAQITNLDFNSIAFSSPTNAMLAGANGNVTISGINPIRYARILKEQSGLYSTRFWYDKLGRLIVSQNTKQYNKVDPANGALHAFSYTLYDGLGRIVEVGEKYENTTATTFTTVFGSLVSGYTNSNAIDSLKFINWIGGNGIRREVTKTYYDNVLPSLPFTQNNLRKRVASTTYVDVYNGVSTNYNHGTHYTYDIHGNVSTLWQENKKIGVTGQEIKQIDYQYDLISGKVNKVTYSPGQVDQFIHKYTYDADNRITKVETSKDDVTYSIDAKYFYYAHGPLARVEYGKDHVQGVDYAYTLQGWIKGINSNILKPSNDMGNDGDGVITNPNGSFARDVMAYSLNYYNGDYAPVDYNKWYTGSVPSTTKWEADKTASSLMAGRNDLFNGNISAMVTTISKPDSTSAGVVKDPIALPMGNAYRYDQLNRIKRSSSVDNISVTTNSWTTNSTIAGLYRNTFIYDANGNIATQVKRDSLGNIIDSLDYKYETGGGKNIRNRLYHVNDNILTTVYNGDIEDQGPVGTLNLTSNYRYDEVGNLLHDTKEGIDSIRWNVYGKIKAVRSSTKDNLYFDYDASGNRIAKHVYSNTGVWKYSNYYERDAQGNVLSVYDKRTISSTMSYKLDEQHLYGSGRLGMTNPNFEMIGALINNDSSKTYLGLKYYELSNHLGNVLTVISDKKIQIANTTNPLLTDHYVSNLVSATDYYPFGQEIYGRRFRQPYYRYAFNGKEKDDELKGEGNSYDYGMRIYDSRLGKFLSVDPLNLDFPWNSTYAFAENDVIRNVDMDGLEKVDFTTHMALGMMNGQPALGIFTYVADWLTDFGQHDIKEGLNRHADNIQQRYTQNGYSKTVPEDIQKLRYTRDKYLANAQITLGFAKLVDKGQTWLSLVAGGIEASSAIANAVKSGPIHIDIGGYGKYENAFNFTTVDAEMAKKIPNLVPGRAQETLLKVNSGAIDLVTIESAPYTKDISEQVVRVLKSGGELRIKTPMENFDAAQYAKDYGLKLESKGVMTEEGVKYQTATFKKK